MDLDSCRKIFKKMKNILISNLFYVLINRLNISNLNGKKKILIINFEFIFIYNENLKGSKINI